MADVTLQMVLDARRAAEGAKAVSGAADQVSASTAKAAASVDNLQSKAERWGVALKQNSFLLKNMQAGIYGVSNAMHSNAAVADKVEKEYNQVGYAARRMGLEIDTAEKRSMSLFSALRRGSIIAGTFFGGFGAAMALRSGIGAMVEFEEQLIVLKNVTGGTVEELESLRSLAEKIGTTTRYSTRQAAEGMIYLAKAGFSLQEVTDALPATLNLSMLGMISLGEAADYTSNIIAQFGLAAKDAGRVVDSLAIVANASNTDVNEMAEALKFAGAVAGAMGVQIEEASAALGALGNSGIKGAMAGTSLRMVMFQLLHPTKAAIKAIEGMGLKLEEVNPITNDLGTIFERLADHGLNATKTIEIFTAKQSAAALILSKNVDDYRELEERQKTNIGLSEKQAAAMELSLGAAFAKVRGAIEAAIVNQEGYQSALKSTANTIGDTVRLLAGFGTEQSKANGYAQTLATSIRILRSVFLAWMAVKIATWLGSLVSSISFTTLAVREMQAAIVAASITAGTSKFGALAGSMTLAAGAARSLSIGIKSLFASIGPAGWLIIGGGIVIEVLMGMSRASEQAAKAAEEQATKYKELLEASNALAGTKEEFGRLEVELKRAVDTENLEAQLEGLQKQKRIIEVKIEDMLVADKEFTKLFQEGVKEIQVEGPKIRIWSGDEDISKQFEQRNKQQEHFWRLLKVPWGGAEVISKQSQTELQEAQKRFFASMTDIEDLRAVMKAAGGEAGEALLNSYLEVFKTTDIAKEINKFMTPAKAVGTFEDQFEEYKRSPLFTMAGGAKTFEEFKKELALPEKPLEVSDITRVPPADAARLSDEAMALGILSGQIDGAAKSVEEYNKAQEEAGQQTILDQALESVRLQAESLTEQMKALQLEFAPKAFTAFLPKEALTLKGEITPEFSLTDKSLEQALKAASDEAEIVAARQNILKQGKEKEIALSPTLVKNLENEIRANKQLEAIYNSFIETLRKKLELDTKTKTVGFEVEITQRSIELIGEEASEREIQIALLKEEQATRGSSIANISDYLAAYEKLIRSQQQYKAEQQATDTIKAMERETEALRQIAALTGLTNKERQIQIALIRAEQQAIATGLKDKDEFLAKMKEQLELQAEINSQEFTRKSLEDLSDQTALLQREVDLLGETNDERQIQLALMAAQQRAYEEGVKDVDAYSTAVEKQLRAQTALRNQLEKSEYTKALDALRQERELIGKTNDERERAERLIQVRIIADKEFGKNTIEAKKAVDEYIRALDELQQARRLQELADDMAKSFAQAFSEIVTGAKSAEDAFKSLYQAIVQLAVQHFITDQLSGWLSAGMGSMFAPAPTSYSPIPLPPGSIPSAALGATLQYGKMTAPTKFVEFAKGGIVNRATVFPLAHGMIGEAGPEIFARAIRGPDNQLGLQIQDSRKQAETYVDNRQYITYQLSTAAQGATLQYNQMSHPTKVVPFALGGVIALQDQITKSSRALQPHNRILRHVETETNNRDILQREKETNAVVSAERVSHETELKFIPFIVEETIRQIETKPKFGTSWNSLTTGDIENSFIQSLAQSTVKNTTNDNDVVTQRNRTVPFANGGVVSNYDTTIKQVESVPFAMGGVVNNYVDNMRSSYPTAFATGGIVNQSTIFPLKYGMIGEAGPELFARAVRGPDNQLGLQVQDSGERGETYIDNRRIEFNFPGSNPDEFRKSESQIVKRMNRVTKMGAPA